MIRSYSVGSGYSSQLRDINDLPTQSETRSTEEIVAEVENLEVAFERSDGQRFAVLRGISFSIKKGEVVGVVGESGSGKSMTARAILGITPPGSTVSGRVNVVGTDLLAMDGRKLRELRGTVVSMVFQDPMTSLNPVRRIGSQIGEAVTVHRRERKRTLNAIVRDALVRVGVISAERRMWDYPHEFSGGMRQRALIAMSVVNDPRLLIADEPTTALDVTVQDQVLDLMRDLNERNGMAILLITHNIAIVSSICSRILVMYAGCIVEDGPIECLMSDPQHPYTWMLLNSVPRIDLDKERLATIEGQPPDPMRLPSGCKFNERCPFSIDRCRSEEPPLTHVGEEHSVRCHVMMKNVREEDCAND